MRLTIRKVEARDESRWRDLWAGYIRFYEEEPSDAVTLYAWKRILDPSAPVYAIVAERDDDGVVAIANYVIHDDTWTLAPVCYLEDLFVDPSHRAAGVGQQLIDWLVEEMTKRGWARLYWHTKETNYRARGLYDKYTPHSGFVRYVVSNPNA